MLTLCLHPTSSDKNRNVANVHPTDEDLSMGPRSWALKSEFPARHLGQPRVTRSQAGGRTIQAAAILPVLMRLIRNAQTAADLSDALIMMGVVAG